ncbi:MAG: hypothetical protein LBK69_07740 [Syntrophomonadaceae bacterium]|jgi:hypothetical protein|nr:hypothetical protein [Syntrophomonadaceae bacterium]
MTNLPTQLPTSVDKAAENLTDGTTENLNSLSSLLAFGLMDIDYNRPDTLVLMMLTNHSSVMQVQLVIRHMQNN